MPKKERNEKRRDSKGRQQLRKLQSDDKLGAASIGSVRLSDEKVWALRMQEQGVTELCGLTETDLKPTTFHIKDVRGYESKREYLPLLKMQENPVVMGYTGI